MGRCRAEILRECFRPFFIASPQPLSKGEGLKKEGIYIAHIQVLSFGEDLGEALFMPVGQRLFTKADKIGWADKTHGAQHRFPIRIEDNKGRVGL